MKKLNYQNYMLFFTFLIFWISLQFGQIVSNSIAYIIILTVGIIHGSNDLIILRRFEKNKRKYTALVFRYLLLILVCILVFLIHPYVALLLFVLISAYHFGEQHLEDYLRKFKKIKIISYVVYGLLIFLMLFKENITEVNNIVYDLSNNIFSEKFILYSLIVTSLLQGVLFFYYHHQKAITIIHILKEIIYFLILFLIFRTTSLILGFAIYFIFWHSIPSILDQVKFLTGVFNKKTVRNYFKQAIPIWMLSIMAVILMYVFVNPNFFSSILFLILFAVTAPHVWVMFLISKN